MAKNDWPRKVGAGWNTSDGYRFKDEKRARAHQKRADEAEKEPARFGANALTEEGDDE